MQLKTNDIKLGTNKKLQVTAQLKGFLFSSRLSTLPDYRKPNHCVYAVSQWQLQLSWQHLNCVASRSIAHWSCAQLIPVRVLANVCFYLACTLAPPKIFIIVRFFQVICIWQIRRCVVAAVTCNLTRCLKFKSCNLNLPHLLFRSGMGRLSWKIINLCHLGAVIFFSLKDVFTLLPLN